VILADIHRRGVLHRDIKPDNIIIHDETVSLIDFGCAILETDRLSLSNLRIAVGTEAYASQRFHLGLPLLPQDDFQCLAYSLYALRMGTDNWLKLVANKQKPSFAQICSEVPFISDICLVSGTSHFKLSSSMRAGMGLIVMGAVAIAFRCRVRSHGPL